MNNNSLSGFRLYIGILCCFLFCTHPVKSQISEGGKPLSFSYQNLLRSTQPVVQIPVNFSVEDIKAVDEWQVSQGAPLAVSTLIDTDLNMENSGKWLTLPGGEEIWQLHIQAKRAIALMLYYDTFYIPKGEKLFIYNADKTQLLGAYTSQTNPNGKLFATEFVAGDELTLEYEPVPSGEKARIAIDQIGYGYNHLSVSESLRSSGSGTSSSCMVNINCEEGEEWQNEKNGVCQMVQKIGTKSFLCTESLVNNTAKDMKPYILSAFHCSQDYDKDIITSDEELNQWLFYFHFEHTGCENDFPIAEKKTMLGCSRKVSIPIENGSDGLLLLLNNTIPEDYNVYFNGWDRSDTPAVSGVNIHHPAGDYMKISTFNDSPVKTVTWLDENLTTGATNAHWNVVFSKTTNGHGVTEGGSSGSPLFNQNKLIVGTLTGGDSNCRLTSGRNIYGKMSYHWDKYSEKENERMDIWLDPLNSGTISLPGLSQSGKEGNLINYKSPMNVTASVVSSNNILIQWDAPIYKQIIGWSTQTPSIQLGFKGFPFYFGQKWDKEDLKDLDRTTLASIYFIPVSNTNYAIYIKQGDREYRQEIASPKVNVSNIIQLKTPFTIDASQELIVAIYAKKIR
ncbi:MAG: protease [Parabacteroides sp.]|nr:protease [Parabacteroides sp.]